MLYKTLEGQPFNLYFSDNEDAHSHKYSVHSINGTAVAGSDFPYYESSSSGNGAVLETIQTYDDNIYEGIDETQHGEETFQVGGTVTLYYQDPVTGQLWPETITKPLDLVIDDAEDRPSLSIQEVTAREADGSVAVTITASHPATFAYGIDISLSSGTATAGEDFASSSFRVTMPALASSATFHIGLMNDATPEPSEVLYINASSSVAGSATGSISITDDDCRIDLDGDHVIDAVDLSATKLRTLLQQQNYRLEGIDLKIQAASDDIKNYKSAKTWENALTAAESVTWVAESIVSALTLGRYGPARKGLIDIYDAADAIRSQKATVEFAKNFGDKDKTVENLIYVDNTTRHFGQKWLETANNARLWDYTKAFGSAVGVISLNKRYKDWVENHEAADNAIMQLQLKVGDLKAERKQIEKNIALLQKCGDAPPAASAPLAKIASNAAGDHDPAASAPSAVAVAGKGIDVTYGYNSLYFEQLAGQSGFSVKDLAPAQGFTYGILNSGNTKIDATGTSSIWTELVDQGGFDTLTLKDVRSHQANVLVAGSSGATLISVSGETFSLVGIERVEFADGAVELSPVMKGSSRADKIIGTSNADLIYGYNGNDTVGGRAGADTLNGGSGRDTLTGEEGRDHLIGGAGVDYLVGGKDRDVFVFAKGATGSTKKTADYIGDFSGRSGDKIDLSAVDASLKKSGDQAFKFIGSKEFSAAGQVRYEKVGKETYISYNTDADAAAEGMIRLKGAVDLHKGWFVM